MNDKTCTLSVQQQVESSRPSFVLEVLCGPSRGRSIPLEGDRMILGRGDEADLGLGAVGVSRKHAKIIRVGPAEWQLVDLGSKNGTFLNEARVETASLREGDSIRLGKALVSFRRASTPAADGGPEAPSARALLSARELEIASLVARGLTNAEVAQRLSISRRTVATHLENVYRRLGIHSRLMLAVRLLESTPVEP